MNLSLDLRPSPIAGQWYPDDPERLAASVDAHIRNAALPGIEGRVVGILTPHAGHRYSGPVAGHAFAALNGLAPDLVAVIAPMHYPAAPALLTTAHAAYQTPLGAIPVDREAVQALHELLAGSLGSGLAAVRKDPEHSLEIELPFLQRTFHQPFSLLPVMVRDASLPVVQALGGALAQVLHERNALLVASSDLSHFYPQPIAERLDGELLRRVEAFDPEAVLSAEQEGKGYACGRGALAAVMWAARTLGADRARILNYATSGDVTGDYSQVVGYGAAVFYQQIQPG